MRAVVSAICSDASAASLVATKAQNLRPLGRDGTASGLEECCHRSEWGLGPEKTWDCSGFEGRAVSQLSYAL